MAKKPLFLLLLGALGCDPTVVDAVREPTPLKQPVPVSPLESSLIHRYSFNGEGAVALDSKGAAHGEILGASLAGTGSLALAGSKTREYVNLPNGIVSGLSDATFEAWLTWDGGGAWQRIFDFGNSTKGEDTADAGSSYLFLTTNAATDSTRGLNSGLRVAYSQNGVGDEDVCFGTQPFPNGVPGHVAVVVDSTAETFALYQDGLPISECPLTRPLSAIDDVNNWLGHSNFSADVDLAARYAEFRIYSAALSARQISDSFKAGPDAKP
jgi:Concanavalin A-like lectin/glucanases superfamily